jgi:hypothetical protein
MRKTLPPEIMTLIYTEAIHNAVKDAKQSSKHDVRCVDRVEYLHEHGSLYRLALRHPLLDLFLVDRDTKAEVEHLAIAMYGRKLPYTIRWCNRASLVLRISIEDRIEWASHSFDTKVFMGHWIAR